MQSFKGEAQFLYDDGQTYDVRVDLRVRTTPNSKSGSGYYTSDHASEIMMRMEDPILSVPGGRIKIILHIRRSNGGEFQTSGAPL